MMRMIEEGTQVLNAMILHAVFNERNSLKPTQSQQQGGITCEAIDEPGNSSKAIDKRVIINFRDKNVVIARFCDKTAYVWGLRYR